MRGDRFCQRCGAYIGNYMTGDYFALLNRKYCDDCRLSAEQESTRLRVTKLRETNRQRNKDDRNRLRVLESENEQLRRITFELREENEMLRKRSALTPEQIRAATALMKLAGIIKEE